MSFNLRPTTPDNQGRERMRFNATLKSVSPNTLKNVNGTEYRVCTVEYVLPTAEVKSVVAFMFEKNYSHGVKQNEEYLCTFTRTDAKNGIINVSHLPATGGDVDVADFEFDDVATLTAKPSFQAK